MAQTKIKMIVTTERSESEMATVINPRFLISKKPGMFGYWFSDQAECEEARENVLNAFPESTADIRIPQTSEFLKVEPIVAIKEVEGDDTDASV